MPQTSKSRRSALGSTRVPRLSRTLKRKVSVRKFVEADVRYLWASKRMHSKLKGPKEFSKEILVTIASQFDEAFIIENTKPFGIIFGVYGGPFLIIGDMIWFPWASNRNKIEGMVKFFETQRREHLIMFYSTLKDKKFYEHVAKHGVVRRIGTVYDLYEGEPATLFQTRTP